VIVLSVPAPPPAAGAGAGAAARRRSPSKAAAAAKAAELVGLPANATQCLTSAERQEITNFGPVAEPVPTLGQTGLLGLGLLLAGFAVFKHRSRGRTKRPPLERYSYSS
jgi:hypothetical protein